MSTALTVSQARGMLPEIMDRVEAGDEVTLTRHGRPVAVIVRPDRLRARRAEAAFKEADRIHELLDQGRRTPPSAGPGISVEYADALIAEIRAGRDGR